MARPFVAILDDAQQPQYQDQDEQPAKSDVHRTLSSVSLRQQPGDGRSRSIRCERVASDEGIILPLGQHPLLLDFPTLDRE